MTTTRIRATAGTFGSRVTSTIKTTVKRLLIAGLVVAVLAALVATSVTLFAAHLAK